MNSEDPSKSITLLGAERERELLVVWAPSSASPKVTTFCVGREHASATTTSSSLEPSVLDLTELIPLSPNQCSLCGNFGSLHGTFAASLDWIQLSVFVCP